MEQPARSPLIFKIALVAIIIAPVLATFAMFPSGETDLRPLLFLAMSLVLFGIGEVINHPLQIERRFTENDEAHQVRIRRRTPCLLGNLLDIVAILFLFTVFSQVISF